MLLISNQTTQASYVAALSFGPDEFDYISYSVWNETVAAQAFDLSAAGAFQLGDWGTEVLLPPSSGIIQKTGGVRFRTNPATPANPGIVSAWGIKSGGSQWLGGVQLTGTLATTGGFTPPATSTMLTGIVSGAGAILGGTGFTVVRTALGIYAITFTTAFAATPTVLATSAVQNGIIVSVDQVTTTGFRLENVTAGGVSVDQPFNFIAATTV